MKLRVMFLLSWTAVAARAQSPDSNLTLPKLGPKPPATGTISTAPLSVTPAKATPVSINPTKQLPPSEWMVLSNTTPSEATPPPTQSNTGAPTAWSKAAAVKAPVLTLAPATNTWSRSPKPALQLATPPPSAWDTKPAKDAWK